MKIRLIKHRIVRSTNDEAIKLIKKGISSPTVITASKQSKGRGRMGKKWLSIYGNLFLTILFTINYNKINFKQYTNLNARLIKQVLSKYVKKKIIIKWPNDLLIDSKKVCGILQEIIEYNKKKFIIVGVGINTVTSPNIAGIKTTHLSKFSKKKVVNSKILKDILKTYEKLILKINKDDFTNIKLIIK